MAEANVLTFVGAFESWGLTEEDFCLSLSKRLVALMHVFDNFPGLRACKIFHNTSSKPAEYGGCL